VTEHVGVDPDPERCLSGSSDDPFDLTGGDMIVGKARVEKKTVSFLEYPVLAAFRVFDDRFFGAFAQWQ